MIINNTFWRIKFVPSASEYLTRSDGSVTIGMTDANTHCIYLDDRLCGQKLEDVLAHELCHCICFSYNIFMPIEEEERLCEFVSKHGKEVFYLLDNLLKNVVKIA